MRSSTVGLPCLAAVQPAAQTGRLIPGGERVPTKFATGTHEGARVARAKLEPNGGVTDHLGGRVGRVGAFVRGEPFPRSVEPRETFRVLAQEARPDSAGSARGECELITACNAEPGSMMMLSRPSPTTPESLRVIPTSSTAAPRFPRSGAKASALMRRVARREGSRRAVILGPSRTPRLGRCAGIAVHRRRRTASVAGVRRGHRPRARRRTTHRPRPLR